VSGEVIKENCVQCGNNINAEILSEHRKTVSHDPPYNCVETYYAYQTIQCRGCDDIRFRLGSQFTEDVEDRYNDLTGEEELWIPTTYTYYPHNDNKIPASDRVVSRKDNQESWNSIDSNLELLGTEISQNNGAGETLGDHRMVFAAEIEASRKLISFDMFDAEKLKQLIIPMLRYLVEKFTDGSIKTLANKLIEGLLKAIA
jgi:hypothetical protein